ncbi:putative baseplate assembly protein [Ruminiclostridium herbifermentans]|uniref:Putative baseplate assembly protein n=1 Tax=Ruminiclostridium herbifermentans TaxID=2488810 RepID=A0A4U7JDR0_9FIRM|nr:putative baseplate assembly protein [Ruminiclostridium herbifermentans]QNU65803.1 putative baseplate assembly protein [Ruminiclostridium herbifermentans]
MKYILPKIDKRSQEDLADQLRSLILEYCAEFENINEIKSDKQVDALVHIFSNMMGHVIEALNQAPDKNFTTFLNLIGVSPIPPRVAKAPIIFNLKKDYNNEGFVPACTKISAQPDNQDEVIFETESDLTVIRPKLVKAASVEPIEDQWSNLDFLFAKEPTGKEATLFLGNTQMVHRLYIGDELLGLVGSTVTLEMDLTLPEAKKSSANKKSEGLLNSTNRDIKIQWYYLDEDGNSIILPHLTEQNVLIDGQSATSELKLSAENLFSFADLPEIKPKEISSYTKSGAYKSWKNRWIYAELKTLLTDENLMPTVKSIKIGRTITSDQLNPDLAIYNYYPLDLSKDFNPFGDKPAFNDTFYIASGEAFSKKDADITIAVDISNKSELTTEKIKLAIEYWNGRDWTQLGWIQRTAVVKEVEEKDTTTGKVKKRIEIENIESKLGGKIIEDTTKAFTNLDGGNIKFKCPNDLKSCIVNGQENYWIRFRIVEGNYGEDSSVKYDEEKVIIKDATYNPPLLKHLKIQYTYEPSEGKIPDMVIAENNFIMSDRTDECFKNEPFKIFTACEDTEPTFYLAFDEDISNLPISLFFPLTGNQIGEKPVVAWEYWNGRNWLTLSVNDAIRDFTRREIQQINMPSDVEKCAIFGAEHYWIRARLEEGGYKVYPKINAVYLNAVWAVNSNTLQGEILGSSNGEPSQTFEFSCTPVLSGQVVKVQETLGRDEWITWEEVQTFSVSRADSRHYMLDSESGLLTFGDGVNGMIPPAGKDNIRCDYKHGGGVLGNVGAGSITKLWDDIPGIESITNPIAADGGFDQEKIEDAKARGPYTLKNRDRGVTCEDIEWLVREAVPKIAIVKCFPTMDRELDFTPGKAIVIVVPEYDDPKPVPSQELLNEIDEYLSERISTVLLRENEPMLEVIGPDYIRIGVEANVEYTNPASGKIIEGRIIDNLKSFLNPLHGGQDRKGWTLGKNLYISEICSEIQNTPGVDFIKDITVKASVQCYTLDLETFKEEPYMPAITYPTYSAVKSSDNRIVFALARKLIANKEVKNIWAKGFRENDEILLRYRNYKSQKLVIVAIDGDVLECKTADEDSLEYHLSDCQVIENQVCTCGFYNGDKVFPVGTDVEIVKPIAKDLTIRSYIMNEVRGNPSSFYIKMAVLETGDNIYISRNDEYIKSASLKIRQVKSENIFLEEDEIIYSGVHLINKKPTLAFPYLQDRDTGIIHDISNMKAECHYEEIEKDDRIYFESISNMPEELRCKHCLPFED